MHAGVVMHGENKGFRRRAVPRLLLTMEELLSRGGPKVSEAVLGPLDEAFFAETIRIEKPLSDWGPERHLTFFYRIPIRENRHFIEDLRARGIID